MYPYLHDFLNDFFGLGIRLPFPMFGFWVAIAFMCGHYFFVREMKRKEGLGLLQPQVVKKMIGEPMKVSEYIIQGIFGFVIGYKGLAAILDYTAFVNDPPGLILSLDGNLMGGILSAALFIYIKHREVKNNLLEVPEETTEVMRPYQYVSNMALIAAVAGILGAKLFHNLENISEFISDPIGAIFSFSGLSIYGGLIVGGFSVVIYGYKNNLKPVHVIDACAPALLFAYAVGRIGCQLSGDGDWGIPNDSPMPAALSFLPEWMWAFDYPNNVLGIDLKSDFISMGYVSETGKAWPTPFYETIMSFILFAFLWSLRKNISIPGLMFSIYILLIGIERFFIEKIRINPPYHFLGIEATQAEVISSILMAVGILSIAWTIYRHRKMNLST